MDEPASEAAPWSFGPGWWRLARALIRFGLFVPIFWAMDAARAWLAARGVAHPLALGAVGLALLAAGWYATSFAVMRPLDRLFDPKPPESDDEGSVSRF